MLSASPIGEAEAGLVELASVEHAGSKRDGAARVLQGVGGVGDQVHHDLPDLGGVGLYRREDRFASSQTSVACLLMAVRSSVAISLTSLERSRLRTTNAPLPE